MLRALRGEQPPRDVLPPIDQTEAGGGSEAVELSRRGVPHRPRAEPHGGAVGEVDEVADRPLGVRIVVGDRQHDLIHGHRPDGDDGADARRVLRDEGLDDEPSARRQPVRDGGEAGGLAPCRLEVEQRVVGDEHDVEGAGRQVVDHVAKRCPDPTADITSAQPIEHRRAGIHVVHVESLLGHRHGHSPGPDAQLEHAATRGGQLGDERDGCRDIADTVVPVVVHIGERIAVRRPSVPLHAHAVCRAVSVFAVAGLIYLDHAATTPMRPEAVEAMLPFLTERFANPSGSHRFARDARRAVDEARDRVADVIGCRPGEVVFTGCGTESDNAAIVGAIVRGRAVCPAAEHHAVLQVVERSNGTVVGVDATAHVDLEQLAAALGPDVSVVSVMAVNNEVGTITDLAAVSRLVRDRAPGAVLHTDAVQAACWLDLRDLWPHVDAMSLSGHKFGGPKGVGVLALRDGVGVDPFIVGGGQERDRRSGTHNVAGIVALAEALAETDAERPTETVRIAALRDRLVAGLVDAIPGTRETVPPAAKVAGSAHVMFEGLESESLLYLLDEAGVCASAASACASGAMDPSHVLAAMGIDRMWAAGALRMTLGRTTTERDVEAALSALTSAVDTLRRRTTSAARA